MNQIILEALEVSLARQTDGGERGEGSLRILANLSLRIPRGEITAVVGPSGSGKSTLLRLLNRLEEPSSGTILFLGKPIAAYPVTELRRRIGWLPQVPVMFDGTVLDNIAYGVSLTGGGSRRKASEAEDGNFMRYLEIVGLPGNLASRSAQNLSIGEKQRVALARTLANGPEALLLDEPTAALDPSARNVIERLIVSLHGELSLTTVLVTHDLDQARRLSKRAVIMIRGSVAECGLTGKLLHDPEEPLCKKFLDGSLSNDE